MLSNMSTLVQIESEIEGLPEQEQWSLLTWLQGRLAASPAPEPEALKVFRLLQAEVRLSPEDAAAWKSAVADARR